MKLKEILGAASMSENELSKQEGRESVHFLNQRSRLGCLIAEHEEGLMDSRWKKSTGLHFRGSQMMKIRGLHFIWEYLCII